MKNGLGIARDLLYVCLKAIWENQFYYMFGFLFLVFIILIISCSQISIVMVYFQLCGEVHIHTQCCHLGNEYETHRESLRLLLIVNLPLGMVLGSQHITAIIISK